MKKILLISILIILSAYLELYGADVKIDSAVFGDIKARNIGPAVMSGRITDIAVYEKDTNLIYVGTASGGVWKSKNKGITFEPVFDKHTMSIGCVTIDQNDPKTVWVGTGEINMRNSISPGTGLYKTTDGGKSWSFMGFKNSERISKVILHPTNKNIVYTAVAGPLWNGSKDRGLYKSEDGGKSWKKIIYRNESTGCLDLDMDPKNPKILYAAMWEFRRKPYFFTSGGKGSGLFKSIDGGKNWKELRKGLPKGILGRIELDVSLSNPNILFAIVEAKETKLYTSTDFGENWKVAGTGFGIKMRPFYLINIKIDPKDPKRIYNPSFTLSISKNGGKSFESSMMSFMGMTVHPDYHAIWIDPNNPKNVLVGTDGGIYESTNSGRNFRFVTNLPVSQFYHISIDMEDPYNVYGGLQDNNSWYGPSSKKDARFILNKDWKKIGGGDGFYIFRDPTDKDIVYYSWQGGMFQRYNEKTAENASIKPMPTEGEPEYRFNWNAAFALSPNVKGMLYAGAQFLFKSTDKGRSWTRISPDLTTDDKRKQQQAKSGGLTIDNTTAENHCSIIAVEESPLDVNLIWVGTDDGNLQVTRNGGKKWRNVVGNIKGLPKHTWCPAVEPSRFEKGRMYVVFDGHRSGDNRSYVYKTEDYGNTWQSLSTPDIIGYCHVIREDLQNPDLLFLGTEFGLFVSFNRGKNWVHFKESLPKVAIRDIKIHPREHDLVLGTHGRGIYILDDITPLRAINTKVFNEDVKILRSRTNDLSLPVFDFFSEGDMTYFGENKPQGAVITYYLKKRHVFGKFSLDILDPSGKKIKSLPARKRRGINRVYWSMTLKAPKTAPSPGLSGMVFGGPKVEPGTYKIRLTKGKKVVESDLILKPDKYSKHSPEDRALRQKTVFKAYKLLEKMAALSKRLGTLRGSIQKLEKKLKSKALKKRLKRLKKKLEGFAYRMVPKIGSIYTNDKLQGKTIEVYSAISAYGGAPSNSQIAFLENQVRKFQKLESDIDAFVKTDLEKFNRKLKAQKMNILIY